MTFPILWQVIAAEGEHKASRALRHAAEVIAECPAALQVVVKMMMMITMMMTKTMITITLTMRPLPLTPEYSNFQSQKLGKIVGDCCVRSRSRIFKLPMLLWCRWQ